jgi:phosphotransferase system HPr-like phosphotransfer protein
VTISADGPDEEAAAEALVALVSSGFGEDTCSA